MDISTRFGIGEKYWRFGISKFGIGGQTNESLNTPIQAEQYKEITKENR